MTSAAVSRGAQAAAACKRLRRELARLYSRALRAWSLARTLDIAIRNRHGLIESCRPAPDVSRI